MPRLAVARPCPLVLLLVLSLCTSLRATVHADDWPMWRCDAAHTASTLAELPAELHLHWVREYPAREPVWDDPLNRDMMPYDQVFEPVVADGKVFVGFNDSDKVVAIDIQTGEELWAFYSDGPVRFSPVVHEDAVLFTSDDGCLYSVDADSGRLRWKFRGGPSDRRIIGNRRVISTWPARGGPVVADDTVYFAAGIWPMMGTFIHALDARTGEERWRNDVMGAEFQQQPHNAPAFAGVAPQGQLAVRGELLLVPGGRTLPAALDRNTGELRFFHFGDKGQGGSFVAAGRRHAYVHTRVNGVVALSLQDGKPTAVPVHEPVLSEDGTIYTAKGDAESGGAPTIEALDDEHRSLWTIAVDGRGDLIRAGSRLYAAGGGQITAVDLPKDADEKPSIAWTQPVDGEVRRLVAACDRLLAVTEDGRIMAFGPGPCESPKTIAAPSSRLASDEAMRELLDSIDATAGYALWFGIDDPELLEKVVSSSDLHLVAVDPDAAKVRLLRERFDRAGVYGKRVAVHVGTPESFMAPPYIAQMVVVGATLSANLPDNPERLRTLYESVRPYGGQLRLLTSLVDSESVRAFASKLPTAMLPNAKVAAAGVAVTISREGRLPGAADWTHAYGDIANTVKSNDRRVRLPLGLLWFGGNSNLDVLPRHGHGPSQQVIGGRLFIEGMNSMSARDVYTGRVLWRRRFEDLGTYQIYYDETYADAPLSTAYNQVHTPGANARGTNYVATEEGVYLALENRCLLLDARTGETVREFVLPDGPDGAPRTWGYIGVYEKLLLAGDGFADFQRQSGYQYAPDQKKGVAWRPDLSATNGLLAFDRESGELLWSIAAENNFLHNGIVAGGGRIYLLDKLPQRIEAHNRRRGITDADSYRLLAVDARTGRPLWRRDADAVFGTWLSYSEKHGLLLQAGSAAVDRSPDEVGKGIAVFDAATGETRWSKPDFQYAGPCILYNDLIITNATSYKPSRGALHLLDGSPFMIDDPVTGEPHLWTFTRAYGCNTAVASENLLTFRSGAAGFCDLTNFSGTGNFGGFKSGCTSNLIIADGVLNAPDYTRTCTCAYQNQTSLALVPMPENEIWTYNSFGQPESEAKGDKASETPDIDRIGVNFGAPGDRLADNGTLWVNYPPDSGTSPKLDISIEGELQWHRGHSSRAAAGSVLPWVAVGGVRGATKIEIRLRGDASDRAAQAKTVKLYFMEPNTKASPGDARMDVLLQGERIARDVDVVARSGGPLRTMVITREDVPIDDVLRIEFEYHSEAAPMLSGIEIL